MYSATVKTCRDLAAGTTHSVTAFTGGAVAIILGLFLVSACRKSPAIHDNSATIVQPGRGVSNVCEVGMTLSQLRAATRDVTTHGVYDGSLTWKRVMNLGRGRFARIPSLGAVGYVGNDQPIALIEFYVRPFRAPMIPGLEVREPFRGKLGGSLSFKDRPVSKVDVENVFGSVSQVATNPPDALEYRKKGERFIYQRGDAVEELWYPDKGVAFVFTSNVVTSFQIYRALGTNR